MLNWRRCGCYVFASLARCLGVKRPSVDALFCADVASLSLCEETDLLLGKLLPVNRALSGTEADVWSGCKV